jgi:hypothetical protein
LEAAENTGWVKKHYKKQDRRCNFIFQTRARKRKKKHPIFLPVASLDFFFLFKE